MINLINYGFIPTMTRPPHHYPPTINHVNSGVMIIDTPGMRELGMWDVSVGLGEAFGDVERYLGRCKFYDCTHNSLH